MSFVELTKTTSEKTFEYVYQKFDLLLLFDKCLSMRRVLIHRTKTCRCSNLFFLNDNLYRFSLKIDKGCNESFRNNFYDHAKLLYID